MTSSCEIVLLEGEREIEWSRTGRVVQNWEMLDVSNILLKLSGQSEV